MRCISIFRGRLSYFCLGPTLKFTEGGIKNYMVIWTTLFDFKLETLGCSKALLYESNQKPPK